MHARIEQALNDQVNNELFSGYMYLAIAAYFDEQALEGFSHWMQLQCREELLHAKRLMEFIADNGGVLRLSEIAEPVQEFASPLVAAEMALQSERDNTEQINDLYELALEHKDHATEVMMQWFIKEQVEEEKSARTIVDRLRLVGEDRGALLVLDAQMGERSAAAESQSQDEA